MLLICGRGSRAKMERSRMIFVLLLALQTVMQVSLVTGRPNIVYILTDDQDVRLDSMSVQTSVQTLLVEKGLSFKNAFTSSPLSCPARGSILTGKYVHNHQIYQDHATTGCYSLSWRENDEQRTIGVHLAKAGYKTGFFGVYLNQYGTPESQSTGQYLPPGWTSWVALIGNSKYVNYNTSENGYVEQHGDDWFNFYFPDEIAQSTVEFIQSNSDGAKHNDTPLFLFVAPPAPHRPSLPAPQYAELFIDHKAPRTPSFGVKGVDKHWLISEGTPPMTKELTEDIDDQYRKRLRTLVSVDDMVAEIVNALESEGLLDNTYIIYNSDKGYHLGQFNQDGGKRQPYDEDIRVPLIVRGPGVPANSITSALATNIDMAPTFMELAGQSIPEDMDGVSLKQLLLSNDEREKQENQEFQFLLEYYGEDEPTHDFERDSSNNTFLGLRSANDNGQFLFAQFYTNNNFPVDPSLLYFNEYYEMNTDPWQMKNSVELLTTAEINHIKELIDQFYKCKGSTCRTLRSKGIN